MSDGVALLVGVLLLVGNAFFVGAEFALISARRSQIEPLAEAGNRRARVTVRAMEQVSVMMAGAQLGITVCSLGLGAIAEPALAHLIEPVFAALGLPEGLVHPVAFAIALSVVVYLHMVLGEMVPKNVAIAGPERSALLLGPPLVAVVTALRPLIALLNLLANAVLRLVRVEPAEEVASAFTHEEVATLIGESSREGLLDEEETSLLEGALDLSHIVAADLVLPSERLRTVVASDPVRAVHEAAVDTGYSRFPVLDDDGDPVAYVHIRDVLAAPEHGSRRVVDGLVADLELRPLPQVAADLTIVGVVSLMRDQRAHLARVLDPRTGASRGVITLEDALEELIGEVRDPAHRAARGTTEQLR